MFFYSRSYRAVKATVKAFFEIYCKIIKGNIIKIEWILHFCGISIIDYSWACSYPHCLAPSPGSLQVHYPTHSHASSLHLLPSTPASPWVWISCSCTYTRCSVYHIRWKLYLPVFPPNLALRTERVCSCDWIVVTA